MPEFYDYKDRLEKFFRFTNYELLQIAVAILVITLIWSARGGDEVVSWTGNFFYSLFFISISVLLAISAQKAAALWYGYQIEYKLWYTGMIIAMVVSLITRGIFPMLMVGGISMTYLSRIRIGEFRYGMNVFENMQATLMGPATSIFFAIFVKAIFWQILGIEAQWVNDIFVFNLVYAFYMMLPLNPLPGVFIFYGSKLWYVFVFAVLMFYILLVVIFDYYTLIGSLILGAVVYFIYFWKVER